MHPANPNDGDLRGHRLPQRLETAEKYQPRGSANTRIFGPGSGGRNAGLVLLDSALAPLYLSAEAERVLSAHKRAPGSTHIGRIVGPLREFLGSGRPGEAIDIRSGRRRYSGRVLVLDPASPPPQLAFAVLLERPAEIPATRHALRHAAERFNLTQRESECLELLAHGLTNKDIAMRLRVSPNTTKCFLRQIMSKTGARTRSGILGRVMEGSPRGYPSSA